MIIIRPSSERGQTKIDWLTSFHSFSFGEYYDPHHMGFSDLRVINEDFISAGMGFPMHKHRDMEILTYVISGQLEHRDSMGNGSVIMPGDIQIMSAGTGVMHSEYNPLPTDSVHLLQIWFLPQKNGLRPRYDQKFFGKESKENKLCLLGSQEGKEGSIQIHQAIDLYGSILDSGKSLEYSIPSDYVAWLQVIEGEVEINGIKLKTGDGASIIKESKLTLKSIADKVAAHFLLFVFAKA